MTDVIRWDQRSGLLMEGGYLQTPRNAFYRLKQASHYRCLGTVLPFKTLAMPFPPLPTRLPP